MSLITQHPWPFGFYPFWFWNDRLTEEEIRWQIAEMADKGVRGFFMHSRQGLQQPYLSESFFHMVGVAVAEAARHGMTAHLYDEYPYPSGVAGGEVILGRPEFQATALVQKTYDLMGGVIDLPLPRGHVLSCVVCPLTEGRADWDQAQDVRGFVGMTLTEESYNEVGLTPYNRKRYFASVPTPTLAVTLPDGNWRVLASVQTVVEGHKYWGQFVDVLNPEAVAAFMQSTHTRYQQHFGDRFGQTILSIFVDETEPGWSSRLPGEFQKAYGDDLLPLLPALQDVHHPEHLRVAADLYRLKYALFCEAFDGPISRWCAAQGLRYTGEKPSLRLSQLRYLDVPGCDAGHTKAGAKMDLLGASIRSNARAVASAAHFYGKEGALCEAYHSLGWSATLQDIKLIAEGLLLHGVCYLVPHGFFYSTHALKKHDAPPTFFFQMPYWRLFSHLTRRLNALTEQLAGSVIDAQVLVVEPASGLPTRQDLAVYQGMLEVLMGEHVEFLLVDTDILEAGVSVGIVLVPPMRVIEPALERWLTQFDRDGGTVLRCGSDADLDPLRSRLRALTSPALRLTTTAGDLTRLHVTARRKGDQRLWFLLNTGGDALELRLQADSPLREVPLEAMPVLLRAAGLGFARRLAPFESLLLEAVDEHDNADPPRQLSLRIGGPMRVRPLHANGLRMGRWRMSLIGEAGEAGQEAVVPAVPLANQLEKGQFQFAPQVVQAFGVAPSLRLPHLRVRYTNAFQCDYGGPVQLVMEPGTLEGEWQLNINGSRELTSADFAPTTDHVRGSLGVDITAFLQHGENEIIVEVQTDRRDGGLRNPLYLMGDFGVSLSPLGLTRRDEQGRFGAWEDNGLPFYAGIVEYETEVVLPLVAQPILIQWEFDEPFESALEVAFNDGPWRPVLWTPRAVLLPPGELRAGANSLRLRVSTALERSFEGQRFDIPTHAYQEVGLRHKEQNEDAEN